MGRSFARIACPVLIAVVSMGAIGALAPAASKARAALVRVAADMKYWLNTDSNIRHNAKCKHFNKTKKGRYCGADEGRAYKLCGG